MLRDPSEYASAVVAGARGTTTAQVAIGLAAGEWGSIDLAAPALDEQRPGLADELRASPYLTRFPASLDPSPFPDTRRFREVPAPARRLPDWWQGSRAPLVYVSFGTVLGHMTIAADVYRTVLDAVVGLDPRVLLTVGHRFDPSALGTTPGHVHVERWVDQSDVLAEADVVVCHGGSGTTFGALAAGVPLVVVPLFADQFSNGVKIAEAGVGLAVGPGAADDEEESDVGRIDSHELAAAIGSVRHDPAFRRRVEGVAAEMAAAPTADEVLDELVAGR